MPRCGRLYRPPPHMLVRDYRHIGLPPYYVWVTHPQVRDAYPSIAGSRPLIYLPCRPLHPNASLDLLRVVVAARPSHSSSTTRSSCTRRRHGRKQGACCKAWRASSTHHPPAHAQIHFSPTLAVQGQPRRCSSRSVSRGQAYTPATTLCIARAAQLSQTRKRDPFGSYQLKSQRLALLYHQDTPPTATSLEFANLKTAAQASESFEPQWPHAVATRPNDGYPGGARLVSEPGHLIQDPRRKETAIASVELASKQVQTANSKPVPNIRQRLECISITAEPER